MATNLICPRCGSKEVIEIGTSRAMCQECYEVFEKKTSARRTESQPPKLKQCPYCMELKPEESFIGSICADCRKDYKEAVKISEETARELEESERFQAPTSLLSEYLKELEEASGDRRKKLAIYNEYSQKLATLAKYSDAYEGTVMGIRRTMYNMFSAKTTAEAKRAAAIRIFLVLLPFILLFVGYLVFRVLIWNY